MRLRRSGCRRAALARLGAGRAAALGVGVRRSRWRSWRPRPGPSVRRGACAAGPDGTTGGGAGHDLDHRARGRGRWASGGADGRGRRRRDVGVRGGAGAVRAPRPPRRCPPSPPAATVPSTTTWPWRRGSAVPTHRSSLSQDGARQRSWQHGRVSEQQKQADNRARATTDEFRAFVAEGWAPRRSDRCTGPSPGAGPAAAAPGACSARAYPRQRLVVPAGGLKVRSNDTDYVFRPHTAFAWLTGLGADREPDAVLVLEPVTGRRRRGIRPRGRALLPPARRPRQRRVLRRRPLRRVLGGRPPDDRRRRARARPDRPPHRRVRRRRGQGCR